MAKHWTERNWNSLTQVKEFLEREKVKVRDFDGIKLVTSKGTFVMVDGQLIKLDKRREKQ